MLRCAGAIVLTGFMAAASPALADPAPIVFAGQGASSSQPVSYAPGGLAGGGEASYGYGAQARPRQGAVIDIRRNASAPPPVEREPLRLVSEQAPSPTPAPAPVAAAPSAPGPRPAWIEQERVGPPYEANGRWYVPTPEPGYEQTGVASWYGPQFHGQRTANGEIYDQEAMTAAHPTLPLNSLVQVTNLSNGREAIVRINDRGPFVGERLIDLSHGVAVALDFVAQGRTQVHVRYLGPAPRRYGASADAGPQSLQPPAAAPQPASVEPVREQSAAAGVYFVQVGAFANQNNANNVRDAVAAVGAASVDARSTANGELFRVRVGPWATRDEASEALRTLASIGYDQAAITGR